MNRDEGSYQLPDIHDYSLSAAATSGGQSFRRRQQAAVAETSTKQ